MAVDPYYFKYDFDHQTAAGADCDFLAIAEVGERNFELVATRAWVSVEGCGFVVGHVFDLDFVVERHSAGSCSDCCGEERGRGADAGESRFPCRR